MFKFSALWSVNLKNKQNKTKIIILKNKISTKFFKFVFKSSNFHNTKQAAPNIKPLNFVYKWNSIHHVHEHPKLTDPEI
jgi:hypothetical protein